MKSALFTLTRPAMQYTYVQRKPRTDYTMLKFTELLLERPGSVVYTKESVRLTSESSPLTKEKFG